MPFSGEITKAILDIAGGALGRDSGGGKRHVELLKRGPRSYQVNARMKTPCGIVQPLSNAAGRLAGVAGEINSQQTEALGMHEAA